ncbi:serine hydrolase domain-containing protein [Microbacterium karelineae]|uniref:serine hydrolase domain-containing protein n=1 Tax=Microbacterium karelineae TaxID=2654283 RepID=UPI0012E9DED4|nr:serine hydrolase domain-containing protein [Microbacterium karelineae]
MAFSLRRGRIVGVSSVLVGALALAGCTGGSNPEPADISNPLPGDVVEQMQAATERAMAGGGAPGAIVGVWVPWAGEWEAGLGETAPGSGTQPTTSMSFRAGEITRSMTCDLLYAMDGGVVDLDDEVTTFVPTVPQLEGVTLVDLCDGLSGLAQSESRLWNHLLGNLDRVWNPREFAGAGLGAGVGNRDAWSDSDTAYFLLGIALENASHTSLRELYAEHIAEPLGLDRTYLPADAAATPGTDTLPGFYSGSRTQQEGCVAEPRDVTELSASIGYADSGVVSNLDDLRDYAADLAERAGSSEELEPRWAESIPVDAGGDQWVRAAGGDRLLGSMIGQQGEILGYSTAAYSDVDTGLTVVVALNNSAGGGELAGALARELAAIAMEAPSDDRPEVSLPWTAEQAHGLVGDAAVCPME